MSCSKIHGSWVLKPGLYDILTDILQVVLSANSILRLSEKPAAGGLIKLKLEIFQIVFYHVTSLFSSG